MERLPQEIVAKVAEYLPRKYKGKLIRPALATLSRSWQYAIETLTFRNLVITSDRLQNFCASIASHPTRRRFVRLIFFAIILPTYSDEDCANYETADDRAANNLAFSRHLSALLQELSQWPADSELKLELYTYSPTDNAVHDPKKVYSDRNEPAMGRRLDLFRERYSQSYISFTRPPTVVVPRVTSFLMRMEPWMEHDRKLDPSSWVALTAALPGLERIIWIIYEPTHFLALRRHQMHEFASAVASFQPSPALKELKIGVRESWYPHNERLPNLNVDGNSICSSLCALLGRGNIQRFSYTGPIDPTLFWPRETDETPSWGSLETLKVKFCLGSLDGQWFFKGSQEDSRCYESSDIPLPQDAEGFFPPGYYDSDEQNDEAIAHAKSMETFQDEEGHIIHASMFRRAPRDEAIIPLIKAVARRLAHTPSLQSVQLKSDRMLGREKWFFSYYPPGQMIYWDEHVDCRVPGFENPVSHARFFLRAGDSKAYEEVAALLRGIGRARNGTDAVVTFVPFSR
ncbi:hypothetical protein KVR01_006332 [Diaporthe batatas]|uniref:uncharacterized protein n=1 Tax=Diaporthe batatas TaxID=748121 RepID=UPI001D03D862|nr:uncharacterized protein KVR01_006332 [Diaporthe batatas]KAG8164414.1 hypothetical protein KVR01_006332 [Diaporthe batatas]